MSVALMGTIPNECEIKSYQVIAEVASNNPHWRKVGGEGNKEAVISTILSIMLLARELGIPPIQAISGGINNIKGKFELSARAMNQLIRKYGHTLKVIHIDDHICTLYGKRKDTGEECEVSYHIEEAIRSGLVKPDSAWKKTPSDMLFARCLSRLARRLFADCIGGCYIEGELQESVQNKIVKPEDLEDVTCLKHEIEIIPPIQNLEFPAHIDSKQIDKFIEESAKQCKTTVEAVRQRASKNMVGFITSFEKWYDKTLKIA